MAFITFPLILALPIFMVLDVSLYGITCCFSVVDVATNVVAFRMTWANVCGTSYGNITFRTCLFIDTRSQKEMASLLKISAETSGGLTRH